MIDFASLVFYALSALTLFSATMVISSKNPVHSVLFLIFAFFNAAGLFILLGAEYIAMTLVIVYVGAVAVLFLFVVMMLNVNFAELRQGFLKYLPLGAAGALLLFAELYAVLKVSLERGSVVPAQGVQYPTPDPEQVSNVRAIGQILYTDYFYIFQLSGIILLVAMIGAIVLTLRSRPGVRRQRIDKQNARKRSDAVKLVKVKSGEGI